MKTFRNALEIYKLLNKSNCRQCHLPTCMAFAGAVYTGQKKLSACPFISAETLAHYGDVPVSASTVAENIDKVMADLKDRIRQIDLREAAERTGGVYANGRLTIKILGKKYSIDDDGNIITDIHVNPWVAIPAYKYVLDGGNKAISGRWVPLRELPSGRDWYRLFGQRCEKPMKKVADTHPDLFEDMVRLFNARQVENHYSSDVSVVLHPLPKLPMLICYWHPENDMESDLNLFFDETAEDYLDLNSINSLGSGFVTMLEKLTLSHS